ncbi:MAG TPA: alcohol dehydrogenase catalytic domain-containing protein, partial [Methylomirabilota bacterium]|nr:alcohol dehydrogenase catalytic domain-containing protein [Methylomirabilota bacterium]
MRAAVLFEQGKPQRVEDVALEAPRQGEVLVRMAASGVCHSCLHAADGSWKGVPLPIVLGDEGAGVVEALGPGVTELAVGDHVILSWAPTCGRCHYCVIGRPNLCERRQPGKGVLPDGTTRMSLGGSPVYHYGHVATYASRTVVHESCAIRIDPAMPLDRAALIGCSVMTGVGAVLNTAAVSAGASMAVFGVGGVGLNVVQGGAMVAAHP